MPIALIFMLVIYVFNVILIGYNIKDQFPEGEWGVSLMIIPVIIFIVYWFVIQARYNVEKSGGKLSIPLEYMNYFLYFLMFGISYLLISFIPYTNDLKIARTANKTELKEDIKNLNAGGIIVNSSDKIEQVGNRYKVPYNNYINTYYWRNNKYDSYDEIEAVAVDADVEIIKENFDVYNEERGYYEEKHISYENYQKNPIPKNTNNLFILATRNQLEELVANYIYSYNKYTYKEVRVTARQIVENELKGDYQDYNYNYYSTNENENDYRYNSWRNQVSYKVEHLARLKIQNSGAFEANYGNSDVSKVILSWLLMMSLLVWIFKQIHWRDYLYGLLALALTPVVVGIFGVFFGIFLRADEEFFFALVFIAYVLGFIFTIKGYISNYKSRFSIVTAMYLHVWLPILPLFYYFFMYEVYYRHDYDMRGDYRAEANALFYSSIIIGLISIGLFKLIYKKMRLLPNHK